MISLFCYIILPLHWALLHLFYNSSLSSSYFLQITFCIGGQSGKQVMTSNQKPPNQITLLKAETQKSRSTWTWELSTVLNLLFQRPTAHMRSHLVKRLEVLMCPFCICVFLCASLTSLKLAGLRTLFHFTFIDVNPWMFPNETSGNFPDVYSKTNHDLFLNHFCRFAETYHSNIYSGDWVDISTKGFIFSCILEENTYLWLCTNVKRFF